METPFTIARAHSSKKKVVTAPSAFAVAAAATPTVNKTTPRDSKLDKERVRKSHKYHQAELVKETVYEKEGWFPGVQPRFACRACQADDTTTHHDKSERFSSREGLTLHLQGPFHSPYSRWRRLRKREAAQFAALVLEQQPLSTNASSSSRPHPPEPDAQKEGKLVYYCPYPFCRSSGEGWATIHELVAHVESSSNDTESMKHEHGKWSDGWGDDAWKMNAEAEKMIVEMKKKYSV